MVHQPRGYGVLVSRTHTLILSAERVYSGRRPPRSRTPYGASCSVRCEGWASFPKYEERLESPTNTRNASNGGSALLAESVTDKGFSSKDAWVGTTACRVLLINDAAAKASNWGDSSQKLLWVVVVRWPCAILLQRQTRVLPHRGSAIKVGAIADPPLIALQIERLLSKLEYAHSADH
jgi:hypothetical protein